MKATASNLKHRQRGQPVRLQQGILLLEALIAILIFSVGVLGMIGLQVSAIQQATDAQYRSIAALKANDLISQMWVSDRTAATLQANFASSGSGTGFSNWSSDVVASGLPGVSSANGTLPTVTFSTVAGGTGAASSSLAVVKVYWLTPSSGSVSHTFVTTSQLKP